MRHFEFDSLVSMLETSGQLIDASSFRAVAADHGERVQIAWADAAPRDYEEGAWLRARHEGPGLVPCLSGVRA